MRVAIVVGSVRPGRAGLAVGQWVHDLAERHGGADYELIDLKDIDLPLLDEEQAPMLGNYDRPHTRRWAELITRFDGFVFVTAEYNHGMPASLKNAIDFLYAEWTDKAAAFVSYGSEGETRAVEQLRSVMAQIRIADVGTSVTLTLAHDFENYTRFRPQPFREETVRTMLSDLVEWSTALRTVRDRRNSPSVQQTGAFAV
ncbi:NADPH-dependent FMN reductase [Cryptosporangium aurantiacum]|uniref:NADPH-dependent FMN reductase n=1 Tax=Cryptosporangium aurantiacum TaxID=134849 RepID=UPI0009349967|nr:NAD(P)H-dependent oxidoreductase [Cryptosporangium aurantiacum]